MILVRFKLWLLLVALFTLLFTGCQKDDDDHLPVEDKDKKEQPTNNTNPEGELTLYKVEGENIEKLKDYEVSGTSLELQKDTKKHQEIWIMLKKVIPVSERERLREFLLFEGNKSGTAGFVTQTEDDLMKWVMGIAIDMAYEGGFNRDGELAYTIIHEFGHLLTLNETQVDFNKSKEECTTYYIQEGCTKENSYLYRFYKEFWKDIWTDYQAVGDSEEKAMNFYNNYKDRFVTEYASTNPAEDIAESFAFFITKTEQPNGQSMADKKVLMFYDYPEFIAIRNYIRSNADIKAKSTYQMLPKAGCWKKAKRFSNHK